MPNLPPSTRRCTTATGAHGFDTDHWTLAQITTVIQRLTGVAYHRGHVGKLLSHAGTIAPSAPPAGRSSAISRPSPARWPRISRRICRNPRRRRAEVVFWDESGASLLPVVRRTWTPQGHTPVIGHRFNWKRASMAAALCYGARGGGAAPPSTTRSTPTTPRP